MFLILKVKSHVLQQLGLSGYESRYLSPICYESLTCRRFYKI